MHSYKDLVDVAYKIGDLRTTRVGPAYSCFGLSWQHNMAEGFPLLTTRKMHLRPILGELAAFLHAVEYVDQFRNYGCNYWDADAKRWGRNNYLGRIYGVQWRNWLSLTPDRQDYKETDQLIDLVNGLKSDPFGRRHLLTAWNPGELDQMALPPCHMFAQFHVTGNDLLSCIVYMRSVDLCLGFPADIALYATLLQLVAQEVGMTPHMLKFFLGDAHIYKNHMETWEEQRCRKASALPILYTADASLFTFEPDLPVLENYVSRPALKYPLNTEEQQ